MAQPSQSRLLTSRAGTKNLFFIFSLFIYFFLKADQPWPMVESVDPIFPSLWSPQPSPVVAISDKKKNLYIIPTLLSKPMLS
jgi:hypothetical protein